MVSPSSAALQKLFTFCSDYGHEQDILYNPEKTMVMISRTCMVLHGNRYLEDKQSIVGLSRYKK